MPTKKSLGWLFAAILALVCLGCGGGGNGGGGNSNAGAVSVFATDDLNAGYDAVWVSVHKVELISGTGAKTAFESSNGLVVDVRGLNKGGQSHFHFFGDAKVSAGTYTGVKITLGKDLALFPTGAVNAQMRTFAGLDASGKKVLAMNFAAPKTVGAANTRLLVDFDLSTWVDDGAFVQNASIKEGIVADLSNPALHEDLSFSGTVTSLTGSGQNFTFTVHGGAETQMIVKTNAETAIFNSEGTPNPSLSNGDEVSIRGRFDPATGAVTATSVGIRNADADIPHTVTGSVVSSNEAGGSFTLRLEEAGGFLPEESNVRVDVDARVVIHSRSGVVLTRSAFFALLQAHQNLKLTAHGTASTAGAQVLVADSIRVDSDEGDTGVYAKGSVHASDTVAGTFTLSLSSWQGFQANTGMQLHVTAGASAQYFDANGAATTRAAFFLALLAGSGAEVRGSVSGSAMTATWLKLTDEAPGAALAAGSVVQINVAGGAFDLSVVTWSGFSAFFGQVVRIDASQTLNFRDAQGNSMTKAQFFAALSLGASAEAVGAYNAQTSAIAATRVRLLL